jgi:hypothetical protein
LHSNHGQAVCRLSPLQGRDAFLPRSNRAASSRSGALKLCRRHQPVAGVPWPCSVPDRLVPGARGWPHGSFLETPGSTSLRISARLLAQSTARSPQRQRPRQVVAGDRHCRMRAGGLVPRTGDGPKSAPGRERPCDDVSNRRPPAGRLYHAYRSQLANCPAPCRALLFYFTAPADGDDLERLSSTMENGGPRRRLGDASLPDRKTHQRAPEVQERLSQPRSNRPVPRQPGPAPKT